MIEKHDDESHVCVNCELANALTAWRESDAPVEDVVEAIRDVIHNIVFAALDDIFEDDASDKKAAN